MSKRSRLILVTTLATIVLIGGSVWFGVQDTRQRERFDHVLEAASRATDAGERSKPLCERAIIAIGQGLEEVGDDLDLEKEVKAYRALGDCQMLLERYGDALKSFEAVLQLQPQQSRAHGDLARALSKLGRHSEAIRSARLSVQLAPHVWQAHRVLGGVLSAAGSRDEAIAAYQKAKSLAPAAEGSAADRAIARLRGESGAAPSETKP